MKFIKAEQIGFYAVKINFFFALKKPLILILTGTSNLANDYLFVVVLVASGLIIDLHIQ